MFAWLLLTFLPKIEPFFTAVEQFIVKHWKAICIALLIGTIAYQNFSHTRYVLWADTIPYLKDQIVAKDAEIKTLKDDLDIAAKANATLTTTITSQNQTVEQWKTVSDDLQKKNAALAGTIAKIKSDNQKKVNDILHTATPTSCPASIDFLKQEKGALTW